MKVVRLGDVCKVVSGSTPKREIAEYWNGTIPWVTPKEISRLPSRFWWESAEKITEAGFRSCSTAMLPVDSLLLSSRAPIGLLAINKIPVCTNQGFKSLIPGKDVHVEYLYYVLKANVSSLQAKGNGATFKELARPAIENFEIPLPPLEDQIRIAHLLGKVEGLINQRKQHLQQLDDLLKSVFLEMFGDPVRNERGWDKQLFSSLLSEIESGKSPKCEARPAIIGEWGVLKLGAVTSCTYKDGENKALPASEPPSVRDEVKVGDLLFSRKNTYELVAACAYVFETRHKLLMPDLIFRLVFREDVEANPIYIWKLLTTESQRKLIQSLAGGAAGSMPNISKANLRNVLLPIPPLKIQNKFAEVVEKVERIKTRYQQSLNDLEALYGALSQKAFKGELDLSRVPIPGASPEVHEPKLQEPIFVRATGTEFTLPDIDGLLDFVQGPVRQQDILKYWLNVYREQLGETTFSIQRFMPAAQTRLAELHPDNNLELDRDDYEHIKSWLFAALEDGRLKQIRDIIEHDEKGEPVFGNLIEIKYGALP